MDSPTETLLAERTTASDKMNIQSGNLYFHGRKPVETGLQCGRSLAISDAHGGPHTRPLSGTLCGHTRYIVRFSQSSMW